MQQKRRDVMCEMCICEYNVYTLCNIYDCAEDGVYNAVWDDKTLLCYDLLQCECKKKVGVSIHSTSCDEGLQSFVGKVSQILLRVCYCSEEPLYTDHHWAEDLWLHYKGGLNIKVLEAWLEKDLFLKSSIPSCRTVWRSLRDC